MGSEMQFSFCKWHRIQFVQINCKIAGSLSLNDLPSLSAFKLHILVKHNGDAKHLLDNDIFIYCIDIWDDKPELKSKLKYAKLQHKLYIY